MITDREARESADSVTVEHEEFDVLSANVDLLSIEQELTVTDLMRRVGYEAQETIADFAINVEPSDLEYRHAKNIHSKALDAVDHECDYVLIEDPPFFGEISDNALYAARNV